MHIAPTRLVTILLPLAGASLLIAVCSGSGSAGIADLIDIFRGRADPAARDVLLILRLPRALTAFGTGAALALAGVLMQVLLRNPLADPYILGTSGGAAVAALSVMLIGGTGFLIEISAFGGALASTVLVFAIAQAHGEWTSGRLLLTGVVVAAGWAAVVSMILAISPEANLRGILFWLMGDFAFANDPRPILIAAGLALIVTLLLSRSLNVLATGEQQATALGLSTAPLRATVYVCASLLTGIAVTTAGTVGFVGLVVPHLIRLISGADHRIVVPAAALAGGSLLVIADTLARTLAAPRQLPVGAITAIVGVPLFLILLRRSAGGPR